MKSIIVYKGEYARELLRKGFQIVDIKPNKKQPLATVFIFKNENGLEEELNRLMDAETMIYK